MRFRIKRALIASLLLGSSAAQAEVGRTEELARLWRESRLADLKAERARIDAEIAGIPAASPNLKATAPALPPAPPSAIAVAAPTPTPTPTPAQTPAQTPDGRQNFGGLDLGVGLSFTLDIGKIPRISRASVVNGVVRTDDQDNGRARIMLESHYFFTPCTWNFLGLKNSCTSKNGYLVADPKQARWGLGPFIAVQPGSDNIIDAIGMGVMIGARREQSAQSFNLGFGLVFDPNTRVLGEGIEANKPLPNDEKEVRYRETLQTGFLVISSFSF